MGVGTGLGVAGLASAGIGAAGSMKAASTQAGAAEQAQQLEAQQAQNALNFQEQEWNTQQGNEAPFLQAGQGAVQQLSQLMQPGGSLTQPWTQQFQAPTASQAAQTPGYQFELQQGTQALDNSAAAQGSLTSGATGAALEQYGQGLASTDYQQAYNNALTQYNTGFNTFEQNQANQFNRLGALAGIGQTTAGQLGQQGGQAAGNVGNISLASGAQQGADINLAGAANASGYVGATNAATGAIGNLSQYVMQQSNLQQLAQLMQQQQGGAGANNPYGSTGVSPYGSYS
jgi:hypothetical protein